jgi:hypothetical protein
VAGLAACGSSSSTSTAQAGVDAYRQQAVAICTQAVAANAPTTARMVAAEKVKQVPALADVTALDNAETKLQKDLAALTPPASIKTSVDKMNADFAVVAARVQALLKQYGAQSIGYDGIDSTLIQATNVLAGDLKALGLTACEK